MTRTSIARVEDDLGEVLHEEVSRLSDRYRMPIVLCLLEGLTHEQAARRLGWPVGTVESRLARGRQRLRLRLARRGLVPTSAGLAAALSGEVHAAVPLALVQSTVRAATSSMAGASSLLSGSVTSLMEGAMKSMSRTKFKMLTIPSLVVAVAVGAGYFAHGRTLCRVACNRSGDSR